MSDAADVRRRDLRYGESYQLALSYGALTGAELAAAGDAMEAAGRLRRLKHGSVVRLPTGKWVVCRVSSGWNDPDHAYLTLSIPMEALRLADRRVRHDDAGLSWRPALDDWLAGIGRQVFEVAPFHSGHVGREATMYGPHEGPVPATRNHGMLVVRRGELVYLPLTVGP